MLTALRQAHEQRWRGLDPLVVPPQVNDDGVAAFTIGPGGPGGPVGFGRVITSEVSETDEMALWGALRDHRLHVMLDGGDPALTMSALLDQFLTYLDGAVTPGDDDCAAVVTVPSRDVALGGPLLRAGFTATTVVAARSRLLTADAIGADTDSTIRQATLEDLSALVELAVELNRHDAALGAVTARESAAELLADAISHQLQVAPDWTWVAQLDDQIVGFAQVQPPEQATWVASAVNAQSVAYFGYQFVRPQFRGEGRGAALAAHAHRALDASEVDLTVLHHAVSNPLSSTFWARQGYRPVWTTWQRRPAVAAAR